MCRDPLLIPGKKGFLSFYLVLLVMIFELLLTRHVQASYRAFLESITRPRVWGERECMQGWKEGKGQLLQLEKRVIWKLQNPTCLRFDKVSYLLTTVKRMHG